MNKQQFIAALSDATNTTKADATRNLDATLQIITDTLASGDDVQFIGFGKFTPVARAARKGTNPSTGNSIDIPASKSVSFKVGAKLKSAVNG